MSAPFNSWSAVGAEYVFWGLRGSSDAYVYGTVGDTLANGSASGMGRLKGVANINLTIPDVNRIAVTGDQALITAFDLPPTEAVTGEVISRVFDATTTTKANNTKIETDGDYKYLDFNPYCVPNNRFVMIANSQANVQDSGASLDSGAWEVAMLYNVRVSGRGGLTIAEATAREYQYSLTLNKTSTTPYGVALTDATNGTTVSYWRKFASPNPIAMHTLIGDGTETEIVLDEVPAGADGVKVKVFVDGVAQTYTTNYTVNVSTRTVTLVAAPTAGQVVVVYYQFLASC